MPVTENDIITSPFPFSEEYIPDVPYHEFLLEKAEKLGDKVCETEFLTGRQETFASVIDKSFRVASFLQKNNLRPGDNVGIHCGNVLEYTAVALGIMRSGCTIIAIFGETSREIRHQVKDAKPLYVFTEDGRAKNVLEGVEGFDSCKGVITFGRHSDCLPLSTVLESDTDDYVKPHIDPKESVAIVLYSSGTSGVPKGVQLTHRNAISSKALYERIRRFQLDFRTALVYSLPVHLSGCFGRLGHFRDGVHSVLIPKFEVETAFSAIEKYGVQAVMAFPTVVMRMLKSSLVNKYNLNTLKLVSVGGGPVSIQVRKELQDKFSLIGVLYVYGQSECFGSFVPCDDPVSIGVPSPGTTAKIIDPETKHTLKVGDIGELCVKGPCIMKSYLNNETATKNAIDEEGWLHTGDLVYCDEKGRLYFVERAKEIMKCKDSQVSPYELEEVLLSHPAVAEAVVIGIPDDECGEVPRAFVTLSEDCKDDLVEFVNKQVADYKKLRGGLCILESLPKIGTGDKYLRQVLKEDYINSCK